MIGYGDSSQKTFYICHHLVSEPYEDLSQFFTGVGINYHIICSTCSRDYEQGKTEIEAVLSQVSEGKFNEIQASITSIFDWETSFGEPEARYDLDIEISSHAIDLDLARYRIVASSHESFSPAIVVCLQDILYHRMAFTNYTFMEIDLIQRTTKQIFNINDENRNRFPAIDFENSLVIEYNRDQGVLAIANSSGQIGYLIDLQKGNVIYQTDRGTYHIEQSTYPLKMVTIEDVLYLIHGSDWNRMDITRVSDGVTISQRPDPEDVDYFYGTISISPDCTWVTSNGWVWQPCGAIVYWNLADWLKNPTECDEGMSKQYLEWTESWDIPTAWYNDSILLLQGYGRMENVRSGVIAFDLLSQEVVGWFPGPIGKLDYHSRSNLLVDYGARHLRLWDVSSGVCRYESTFNVVSSYNGRILYVNEESLHILDLNSI